MDSAQKCDPAVYNALPDLDVATSRLGDLDVGFQKFMESASAVVTRAGLGNGELGALLLHRHWLLEQGKLMLERPRVLESGKVALVTASVDEATALDASPSRWAASPGGRLIPLEFSTDPYVRHLNVLLERRPEVIRSLTSLLEENELLSAVGLMVIPRKSFANQRFDEFVEENFDGVSVVTGHMLSPLERGARIKTGWPLPFGRGGTIFKCCYCMHGGGLSCKHPLPPDPPICRPTGCV